jgi:hypothetical protein
MIFRMVFPSCSQSHSINFQPPVSTPHIPSDGHIEDCGKIQHFVLGFSKGSSEGPRDLSLHVLNLCFRKLTAWKGAAMNLDFLINQNGFE